MEKMPNSSDGLSEKENTIIDRIEKDLGIPGVKEKLSVMANTDFQSLFLAIMESKSKKVGLSDLNSAIENSSYIISSEVPQIDFIKLDIEAYGLLSDSFKGIDLSPLVPFGTNVLLADINQKRILSTTRGSEVMSDPTTALVLHCAKERAEKVKKDSKNSETIKLATSQRVIRQNKLTKSGQKQHFRSFTLMSAGRDIGFEKFEKDNLKEQLVFVLSLCKRLNETGEYEIKNIKVSISDVSESKKLIDIVGKPVSGEVKELFPEVIFDFDLERKSNYYKNLCFIVTANNNKGKNFSICGGGMTDWTEKIVGSKKERLMFSSVGSEILCGNFKI